MFIFPIFIRTKLIFILFIIFLPIGITDAISETGFSADRHYRDGIELSKSSYWKEASEEFSNAIKANPNHKLAYANLGVSLSKLGKHKEALIAFDEALKLGYNHALLHYNRGLSFAQLNLIDEAVKEVELSLRMNARNVKAVYNLGLLYLKQKRLDDVQSQIDILYTRNNNLSKKLFTLLPHKYKVISVKNGGSLKGKVILSGKIPRPRLFPLIASPNIEYCNRISDGKGNRILSDFTVSESRGLKDTVIKLVGIQKGKSFENKIPKLVMDRCHIPNYVIGIRNGETIILENTDPIRHEIATYEITNRGVTQRSHRPVDANTSQARDIFVKQNTENFLIKCNLHPFLQSQGVIINNPYYAITDEDGLFSINNIPSGTYKVIAWHPYIQNQIATITIEQEKQSRLDFEFKAENVQRKLYNDDWAGYRFQPVYDSDKNFYGGPRVDDPVEILQVYKKFKN